MHLSKRRKTYLQRVQGDCATDAGGRWTHAKPVIRSARFEDARIVIQRKPKEVSPRCRASAESLLHACRHACALGSVPKMTLHLCEDPVGPRKDLLLRQSGPSAVALFR